VETTLEDKPKVGTKRGRPKLLDSQLAPATKRKRFKKILQTILQSVEALNSFTEAND
jgi:hypothetical protein